MTDHASPGASVPGDARRVLGPAPVLRPPGGVVLRVEGLSKRFPDSAEPAVREASLHVREGDLVALFGPSGCGKTTTLRMIGGFEAPDAGRVVLDGCDVTTTPAQRRAIGFVFQDYALFPHLCVLDNILFELHAMPRAAARRRASDLLALVGLADLARRMPHELSGGQQ